MALVEVASRPLISGASLTASTTVTSATLAEEKEVVPPLEVTLTVSAFVSAAELSTRRVVREPGVPFQFASGWKLSLVVEARKSPAVSESPDVAISVQDEDPLACHCHLPWEEVAALPVMTTPAKEPESRESLKLAEKRLATVAPA